MTLAVRQDFSTDFTRFSVQNRGSCSFRISLNSVPHYKKTKWRREMFLGPTMALVVKN